MAISCSTPCGISGLAGHHGHFRHQFFTGAQRLAASVVWQADARGFNHNDVECSTPCGISGLAGWAGAVRMVLPSGAQRLAASVVWQGSKCFLRSAKPMSAQRLAASVVWQDILRRITPRIPPLCSTPCGISGLAGTRPANSVGLPERCSTPCGISGLAGGLMISATSSLRSAQRLAASVVWQGGCRCCRNAFTVCAQRLAASVVWQAVAKSPCRTRVLSAQTPCGISGFGRLEYPNPQQCYECLCSTPCGISGLAGTLDPVSLGMIHSRCFNALRHQWFGRAGAVKHVIRISGVLNALRHQWFGRIAPLLPGIHGLSCLNALRHQWFGRCPGRCPVEGWPDWCSTPCGISGLAGGY